LYFVRLQVLLGFIYRDKLSVSLCVFVRHFIEGLAPKAGKT
jgi:hypothetical protein